MNRELLPIVLSTGGQFARSGTCAGTAGIHSERSPSLKMADLFSAQLLQKLRDVATLLTLC